MQRTRYSTRASSRTFNYKASAASQKAPALISASQLCSAPLSTPIFRLWLRGTRYGAIGAGCFFFFLRRIYALLNVRLVSFFLFFIQLMASTSILMVNIYLNSMFILGFFSVFLVCFVFWFWFYRASTLRVQAILYLFLFLVLFIVLAFFCFKCIKLIFAFIKKAFVVRSNCGKKERFRE